MSTLGSDSGDQFGPMPALDNLLEIRDPEIDPDQIMEAIRLRIKQRREELGYENRTFPVFGAAAYLGEPDDVAYDSDLHHYLRLANEHYGEADTEPILVESPATRLPILGKMWRMVRSSAHHLVLYYVNRSVAHQTSINGYLISVLNRMTVLVEGQQRTIDRLRAEIEVLRRQSE